MLTCRLCFFFFFNDTATTEIYTLSLHDALPISRCRCGRSVTGARARESRETHARARPRWVPASERSEEHTSELQSQSNLVCRLLLEKKKKKTAKPNRQDGTSHRHRLERASHARG